MSSKPPTPKKTTPTSTPRVAMKSPTFSATAASTPNKGTTPRATAGSSRTSPGVSPRKAPGIPAPSPQRAVVSGRRHVSPTQQKADPIKASSMESPRSVEEKKKFNGMDKVLDKPVANRLLSGARRASPLKRTPSQDSVGAVVCSKPPISGVATPSKTSTPGRRTFSPQSAVQERSDRDWLGGARKKSPTARDRNQIDKSTFQSPVTPRGKKGSTPSKETASSPASPAVLNPFDIVSPKSRSKRSNLIAEHTKPNSGNEPRVFMTHSPGRGGTHLNAASGKRRVEHLDRTSVMFEGNCVSDDKKIASLQTKAVTNSMVLSPSRSGALTTEKPPAASSMNRLEIAAASPKKTTCPDVAVAVRYSPSQHKDPSALSNVASVNNFRTTSETPVKMGKRCLSAEKQPKSLSRCFDTTVNSSDKNYKPKAPWDK